MAGKRIIQHATLFNANVSLLNLDLATLILDHLLELPHLGFWTQKFLRKSTRFSFVIASYFTLHRNEHQ